MFQPTRRRIEPGQCPGRGLLLAMLLALAPAVSARGDDAGNGPTDPASVVRSPSLVGVISESLFGDVYAEGRWRPLELGTFFSDGWLEPWAVGPAGREGLTPRHGWLGAFNGVFFRLWSAQLNYSNGVSSPVPGNRYTGSASIFLPFSRRFEVLIEDPFVVSGPTADPRHGYRDDSGDLVVAPRFLLAESAATTHVFALEIRTPTGSHATGGGITSLAPRYEFWTNPFGAWVVRGSTSLVVPLGGYQPSPTQVTGGLAVGRYFTPHDMLFGDLALYLACDLGVPLNDTASTKTDVTLGPGTRFHLGADYYFLNYWAFPVTGPHPENYVAQFAVVKIF